MHWACIVAQADIPSSRHIYTMLHRYQRVQLLIIWRYLVSSALQILLLKKESDQEKNEEEGKGHGNDAKIIEIEVIYSSSTRLAAIGQFQR